MFTFEWQTKSMNGAGNWYPKSKVYKTKVRAEGAALKWQADMAAENCPVDCRVCELVSDGKGGKVLKVLFDVK